MDRADEDGTNRRRSTRVLRLSAFLHHRRDPGPYHVGGTADDRRRAREVGRDVVGGVLMSVVESEKAALDIDLPLIIEALDFKAPYVVERLVSDRVADTEAEAKELF